MRKLIFIISLFFTLACNCQVPSIGGMMKPQGTVTPPLTETLWAGGGSVATTFLKKSTDNGDSWTDVFVSDTIFDGGTRCIAYNGSRIVIGGGSGSPNSIAYSDDLGASWTGIGYAIFDRFMFSVIWNGSQFVGVGSLGAPNTMAYSADGETWTGLGTTGLSASGECIAYNGSVYLAGGDASVTLRYSTDGTTWNNVGKPISTKMYGLAYSSTTSTWYAAGSGTHELSYCTGDPTVIGNWTDATSADTIFTNYANAIATNGTTWVAVGLGTYTIAYSTDGINWTGIDYGSAGMLSCDYSLATGYFYIAGNIDSGGNSLLRSTDGINWTGLGNPFVAQFIKVIY